MANYWIREANLTSNFDKYLRDASLTELQGFSFHSQLLFKGKHKDLNVFKKVLHKKNKKKLPLILWMILIVNLQMKRQFLDLRRFYI